MTLDGQCSVTDLMASSIVKVLRSQETTATISACAILCPLKDVDNFFVITWRGGAIDKDCASSLGLAHDGRWIGDVSILEVLHRNIASWVDCQSWIGAGIIGCSLRRVTEEVGAVDARTTRDGWRQDVVVRATVVARVCSSHVASHIAMISDKAAVGGNDLHLLYPAVCICGSDEGEYNRGSSEPAHGL